MPTASNCMILYPFKAAVIRARLESRRNLKSWCSLRPWSFPSALHETICIHMVHTPSHLFAQLVLHSNAADYFWPIWTFGKTQAYHSLKIYWTWTIGMSWFQRQADGNIYTLLPESGHPFSGWLDKLSCTRQIAGRPVRNGWLEDRTGKPGNYQRKRPWITRLGSFFFVPFSPISRCNLLFFPCQDS